MDTKKQAPSNLSSAEPIRGTTAVIGSVIKTLKKTNTQYTPDKQSKLISKLLSQGDKEEIVEAALLKYCQAEELKPYQAELIKMQKHLERTGKKVIVLFDGRDASGKGGTIRRVTRYMKEDKGVKRR